MNDEIRLVATAESAQGPIALAPLLDLSAPRPWRIEFSPEGCDRVLDADGEVVLEREQESTGRDFQNMVLIVQAVNHFSNVGDLAGAVPEPSDRGGREAEKSGGNAAPANADGEATYPEFQIAEARTDEGRPPTEPTIEEGTGHA